MRTQEPREFWIEQITKSTQIVYEYPVDGLDEDAIHVIEYSAYAELESKLQIAVKSLEKICSLPNCHFLDDYELIKDIENKAYDALNKIKGDAE